MSFNFNLHRLIHACKRTVGVCMVLHTTIAMGTPSQTAQIEIEHLLQFTSNSNCTYIRNLSTHSGKAAREHMQNKLDYFKKQIKTAEDFIALAASKSELTGAAYRVRCEGQAEQTSAQWLGNELKRLRQTQPTPTTKP